MKSQFRFLSLRTYIGATILLISLCWVQELVRFPFNHDNAAILDIAQRLLDGELLYADNPEPNPPLIFIIAKGITLLSQVFGSDLMTTWRVSFLFLTSLVIGYTGYLLAKSGWDFACAGPQAFLWVLIGLCFSYSGYNFSQREHLAVLLALPYLVISSERAKEKQVPLLSATVAGFLAGIGFSFKPFFLLVFGCVQVYLMSILRKERRRWFFPESIIILLISGGFWTWVVLGTSYVQCIKFIQPFYVQYNIRIPWLFLNGKLASFYLATLLHRRYKPVDDQNHLRQIFFLGALSFSITYFIQMKGWSYHALPSQILSLSLIALVFLDLKPPMPEEVSTQRPLLHLGTYILIFILLYTAVVTFSMVVCSPNPSDYYEKETLELTSQIRDLGPGKKVHILSTQCMPNFPALTYCGLRSTQRNFTFLIIKLYGNIENSVGTFPYDIGTNSKELARLYINSTIEDIALKKPDYIFSDERPFRQGIEKNNFNFIDFLMLDVTFRSLFEKNYTFLRKSAGYKIFQRID